MLCSLFPLACAVESQKPIEVVTASKKSSPSCRNSQISQKRIPHRNDSPTRNSHGVGSTGLCHQGSIATSLHSHYHRRPKHKGLSTICYTHRPGTSQAMLSARRADDALPNPWTGVLPPGNQSGGPSTVNIFGRSIIDVAGNYHNPGDVFQRISIHNSQSGQFGRGCSETSRFH